MINHFLFMFMFLWRISISLMSQVSLSQSLIIHSYTEVLRHLCFSFSVYYYLSLKNEACSFLLFFLFPFILIMLIGGPVLWNEQAYLRCSDSSIWNAVIKSSHNDDGLHIRWQSHKFISELKNLYLFSDVTLPFMSRYA